VGCSSVAQRHQRRHLACVVVVEVCLDVGVVGFQSKTTFLTVPVKAYGRELFVGRAL
jgi:hypothetical protein